MDIIFNPIVKDYLFNGKHLRNENYLEVLHKFESIDPLIIDNSKFLTLFLEAVSKSHAWYHHYTNFDGFKAILETNSFKLTKGVSSKLNDLHEPENKGDMAIWERTYIMCFSYGGEDEINYKGCFYSDYRGEENIAMWTLYGKPKTDAIRISFRLQSFLDLLNNPTFKDNEKNDIDLDKIDDIYSTDIFYAKGNNEDEDPVFQRHIDKKIQIFSGDKKLFDYLKDFNFTGCVKNYSWNYENEVRIITRIKEDYEELYQKDAIFLNIPNHLINSFFITYGPSFTRKDELANLLKEKGLKDARSSVLFGKVNFKDL